MRRPKWSALSSGRELAVGNPGKNLASKAVVEPSSDICSHYPGEVDQGLVFLRH